MRSPPKAGGASRLDGETLDGDQPVYRQNKPSAPKKQPDDPWVSIGEAAARVVRDIARRNDFPWPPPKREAAE